MQEDLLQPLITVQEAMTMAADLKLGSDMSTRRKTVIVCIFYTGDDDDDDDLLVVGLILRSCLG